jgi:mono/diheme cytochrome c family protein
MPVRLLSVLLVLSPVSTLAAGDPDAAKGLLVEYCADCHAMPDHVGPATGLPAPSFTTIADDPDVYTEERLRASLEQPHWPMGGLILSPSDIDNILAYLATIRHR